MFNDVCNANYIYNALVRETCNIEEIKKIKTLKIHREADKLKQN